MADSNSFQFCFDLLFNKKLNAYLPVSYVLNNAEPITYVDKKATKEVISGYGINFENLDDNIKKALKICDDLKSESLFKKFSKNIKSAKNIDDLLTDNKIVFGINDYIKTNLELFLKLITENNFPISLNLSNNKDFYNYQIAIQNSVLEPHLKFEKNENGISYSLFLKENQIIYEPVNHQIELILDDPCWIVIDTKLCPVGQINAKKITPFLKKKTIEIPTKTIPEFFEKFIKDIVKKVDIEAIGFEVIQKKTIKNCNITTEYDFFKRIYYINLIFDYDGYNFDYSKSKNIHSKIDLSNLEHIKVIQYKRNENEINFENKLLENGFQKTENGFFKQIIDEKTDAYQNIQWLINNREVFEQLGFSISNLKIDGKKIIAHTATIYQTNDLKNDWFDVKMTVFCGDFQFNFTDIISNIKNKNRIFTLPDGSIFLIPLAWFKTYAPLVKLATNENGVLKLPKSNFAVLDNFSDFNIENNPAAVIEYKPSNLLKATLRPYQEEGVKWLLDHYNNQLGACLADDMGLGKTLQVLATLVAVKEQLATNVNEKEPLKALIILPSSLVFNWNNEVRKFAPHFHKIQFIGNDRKLLIKKLDKYDLIFTTYSIISRDISVFEKYNFRYLILDESQYIKNKNSKVFKAISSIKAIHKISLSGTPIENSLDDLWSQMEFINPNILGSFKFFTDNYKIPIQKKQDETALNELKKIVQPFILRRTKEQVLKDLPELTEQIFYCNMEPDQEKLYEEEKSKIRNYILKTEGVLIDKLSIINSLMRLRQLSNHPKMIDKKSEMDSGKYIAVTNYLENLLKTNQKTIVFSSFVANLDFYIKWCEENKIDYCQLTGETSMKDREIAVNRFQNQEKPLLFFISLKAGGVGLNITRASFVLFLDPWWNPFSEKQGISRAHRIGQKNKVSVIRFITKNTVEEKILILQENKKILSDSLLDENYISPEIEENLSYILE